ncbi:MAG: DNA methyltransferase, partial [Caldisphaera sp.]
DNTKLKKLILKVLEADERLWNKDKSELNQTLLFDLMEKVDENIINLLFQEKDLKDKFFVKINDAYVFKTNDFRFFMEENKVDNSYTSYERRIGLTDGKRFLKDTNDVVLSFPYKDCVLEGGQSTEEGTDTYFEYSKQMNKYEQKQSKRKEIFFNEILAKDEIDRLFDPKALVNWKRFTKNGEEEVKEIKRDKNGTIKENLIIKGNNLLALHSLKEQFAGRVKLIYIDPPYNTGNDDFKYNDNFNHSTWLTFMKNRLEVAKELLRDDGAIFVQISDKEVGYLHVLMDEIFTREQFINKICVKARSPAGFKTVNQGVFESAEYILVYGKKKENWKYIQQYEPCEYDKNYKFIVVNKESPFTEWKIYRLSDYVVQKLGFKENKKSMKNLDKAILLKEKETVALENADKVFRLTAINNDAGRETLIAKEQSLKERDKIILVKREGEMTDRLVLNGELITFYNSKVKDIDGKKTATNLLSNIWTDVAWEGIANEGEVTLNKGKKPEKLLKRIIDMSTEIGDIILDYHLGSGTTCAVA